MSVQVILASAKNNSFIIRNDVQSCQIQSDWEYVGESDDAKRYSADAKISLVDGSLTAITFKVYYNYQGADVPPDATGTTMACIYQNGEYNIIDVSVVDEINKNGEITVYSRASDTSADVQFTSATDDVVFKTSELSVTPGFVKELDSDNNVVNTENSTIVVGLSDSVKEQLDSIKVYTAGSGITLSEENVIALDTSAIPTYTAGSGINISSTREITLDTSVIPVYTAGDGVEISSDNVISSTSSSSTLYFGDGTDTATRLVAGTGVTLGVEDDTATISFSGSVSGSTVVSAGTGMEVSSTSNGYQVSWQGMTVGENKATELIAGTGTTLSTTDGKTTISLNTSSLPKTTLSAGTGILVTQDASDSNKYTITLDSSSIPSQFTIEEGTGIEVAYDSSTKSYTISFDDSVLPTSSKVSAGSNSGLSVTDTTLDNVTTYEISLDKTSTLYKTLAQLTSIEVNAPLTAVYDESTAKYTLTFTPPTVDSVTLTWDNATNKLTWNGLVVGDTGTTNKLKRLIAGNGLTFTQDSTLNTTWTLSLDNSVVPTFESTDTIKVTNAVGSNGEPSYTFDVQKDKLPTLTGDTFITATTDSDYNNTLTWNGFYAGNTGSNLVKRIMVGTGITGTYNNGVKNDTDPYYTISLDLPILGSDGTSLGKARKLKMGNGISISIDSDTLVATITATSTTASGEATTVSLNAIGPYMSVAGSNGAYTYSWQGFLADSDTELAQRLNAGTGLSIEHTTETDEEGSTSVSIATINWSGMLVDSTSVYATRIDAGTGIEIATNSETGTATINWSGLTFGSSQYKTVKAGTGITLQSDNGDLLISSSAGISSVTLTTSDDTITVSGSVDTFNLKWTPEEVTALTGASLAKNVVTGLTDSDSILTSLTPTTSNALVLADTAKASDVVKLYATAYNSTSAKLISDTGSIANVVSDVSISGNVVTGLSEDTDVVTNVGITEQTGVLTTSGETPDTVKAVTSVDTTTASQLVSCTSKPTTYTTYSGQESISAITNVGTPTYVSAMTLAKKDESGSTPSVSTTNAVIGTSSSRALTSLPDSKGTFNAIEAIDGLSTKKIYLPNAHASAFIGLASNYTGVNAISYDGTLGSSTVNTGYTATSTKLSSLISDTALNNVPALTTATIETEEKTVITKVSLGMTTNKAEVPEGVDAFPIVTSIQCADGMVTTSYVYFYLETTTETVNVVKSSLNQSFVTGYSTDAYTGTLPTAIKGNNISSTANVVTGITSNGTTLVPTATGENANFSSAEVSPKLTKSNFSTTSNFLKSSEDNMYYAPVVDSESAVTFTSKTASMGLSDATDANYGYFIDSTENAASTTLLTGNNADIQATNVISQLGTPTTSNVIGIGSIPTSITGVSIPEKATFNNLKSAVSGVSSSTTDVLATTNISSNTVVSSLTPSKTKLSSTSLDSLVTTTKTDVVETIPKLNTKAALSYYGNGSTALFTTKSVVTGITTTNTTLKSEKVDITTTTETVAKAPTKETI